MICDHPIIRRELEPEFWLQLLARTGYGFSNFGSGMKEQSNSGSGQKRKNMAFVGIGSCDNVQTERSIFKYANWLRLQIKRIGLSSWSDKLTHLANFSSWIYAYCPMHIVTYKVLKNAHVAKCTCYKVHML